MKLAVTTAALALSLLAAQPAAAYCSLNLRYENGSLKWDRIDGATDYWIVETYGTPAVVRHFSTRGDSLQTAHRSSETTMVRYTVTAPIATGVRSLEGETNDACAGTIDVEVLADAAFRKLTRRAVLPVVGSTPGSFGGKFKTSLILRPIAQDQRGRIVFHPAGQAGSDFDPSIRYEFKTADPLVWDDIVAAIGQSGIGSIDIIPDETAPSIVPAIEARLYNETSFGTFGTLAAPVYPYDYLYPNSLDVTIPESDTSRINIGFRALTEVKLRIFVYNAAGQLLSFNDVSYPAGWMQMTSADAFVGKTLGKGQRVQVSFTGAAIPFHTVTENSTNDPTLVVVSPRVSSRNVGAYVD
ncbi:MAG TPA: hypothetical protein VEU30_07325 [Thermoanaerobaculia bacterium]|nr:hypothetical protein [Thermoanaerobaculia bacterium]